MISPAQNIDEVIAQLNAIVESSIQEGSREGYFAALYLRVTRSVKEHIQQGYFADNERMEKLDVIFANRYLTAYASYHQSQPCSISWKVAFDACHHWKPLVLQHLFLGMNAHIGLDLGVAAATVAPGTNIEALKGDFDKINGVLASLVSTVQNELAEMWTVMKIADQLAGHLGEEIASFSMEVARNAAWRVALGYAPLTTDEQRQVFVDERDQRVAQFSQKLAQPGIVFGSVVGLLRVFEHGSVPRKIQILLG